MMLEGQIIFSEHSPKFLPGKIERKRKIHPSLSRKIEKWGIKS